MKLRAYQKQTYKAVVEAIKNKTERCSVYAATGAGKTVIFTKAIEHLFTGEDNKKVLVVHPRIALSIDQQRRFRKTFALPFTSFHSGVVVQSTDRESKTNVRNRSTTSRDVLETIMQREENHIVFSSYDSLHKIADMKFDLTICDEAHYLVQEQYHDVLENLKSPVMFFTATPIDTRENVTMCNTEIFGECIARIEPKELIREGYLTQPKMFWTMISSAGNENNETVLTQQIAHTYVQQRAELNSKKIPHKMLVAMSTTKSFRDIMSSIKEIRDVTGSDVDLYYITASEQCRNGTLLPSRADALEEFAKNRRGAIILHCDTLAEGIDIDGLTGAYVCRGLQQAKFIQTLGRVLRPWKKDIDENDQPLPFEKREKKYGLINVAIVNGMKKADRNVDEWFYALMEAGFDNIHEIVGNKPEGSSEPGERPPEPDFAGRILDLQFKEEARELYESRGAF